MPIALLSISLSLGSSWLWLLPALLLSVGLAAWAYPPGPGPLAPRPRAVLRLLRGGGVLLLALLLLAPVLRWPEAPGAKFRVVLLADRSLSMQLPPGIEGAATRAEVVERVAGAISRGAGSRLEVAPLGFARGTWPADSAGNAGLRRTGATAIGDVLGGAGGLAGDRPAAFVVISDGVTTEGSESWNGAERLGLPVFTVSAADTNARPDAILLEAAANATAYAGRPAPVQVTLAARGLAGRETHLELREAGKVLSRTPVRLPRTGRSEVTLTVQPASPGVHFYEVQLVPLPGELTALNNTREFALDVLADKARVVLIQSAPNFDFSFVRRSLEEEPDFAPEFWLAGPGGTYRAPDGNQGLPPAALAARLAGAAVIALGDMDNAPGRDAILAAVAQRVRAGAGLWVYGGPSPAGLTGYAGTPLAALLPFAVDAGRGAALTGSPSPAEESRDSPLFGEGGAGQLQATQWEDLPPAPGILNIGVRGGARRVLRIQRGPATAVAATYEPPSGGRVFALNVGQLYRWTFTAQGATGGNDVFPAFLSRVWRWLNEPGARAGLAIRPDVRVTPLGDVTRVDVSGAAAGSRLDVAALDAKGSATPMTVSQGSGGSAARAEAILPAGRYRVVARELRGSVEAARAQTEVAVEPTGLEWLESAPDPAALRRTAEVSGGQFFNPADTAPLVRALRKEATQPRGSREVPVHRQMWPYALVLLMFGTEWWVRRRNGLP